MCYECTLLFNEFKISKRKRKDIVDINIQLTRGSSAKFKMCSEAQNRKVSEGYGFVVGIFCAHIPDLSNVHCKKKKAMLLNSSFFEGVLNASTNCCHFSSNAVDFAAISSIKI